MGIRVSECQNSCLHRNWFSDFYPCKFAKSEWNKTPTTFNDKIRTRKEINFFLSFFFFLAMNTKFTSLWAIVCTNRMLPFRLSISVAFNPFTILESNPHVVRIRYFLNTLNDGLERLHYHLWLWILMRMFVQKSEYVITSFIVMPPKHNIIYFHEVHIK